MENVTKAQWELMDSVLARVSDIEVRWNEERGVASLLAGRLIRSETLGTPEEIVGAVLRTYGVLLGPADVARSHQVTGSCLAKGGVTRSRALQLFRGVPVHGATLLVFSHDERGTNRVQSSFWREIDVTAQIRLDESDLAWWLLGQMRQDPGAVEFEERWRASGEHSAWQSDNFPLIARPRVYLLPVDGGFHPAFEVWAYQGTDHTCLDGFVRHGIDKVQLMLDATDGAVLWKEPAKEGFAAADVAGDGMSTLRDELGSPIVRGLHLVREDSSTFLLVNRTQTPEIRTYDAGGSSEGIENKLRDGTGISRDASGHWNRTTASCSPASRADSQQPEADAHYRAEQAWNFYHPLGWDGFDNGRWGDHRPLQIVTHVEADSTAYFARNVAYDPELKANTYDSYLAFGDGHCVAGRVRWDFMAGDPIVFGHEYQHGVTFYGARTSRGDPGHLYGNKWLAALREGLSDAMACLQHGQWQVPPFSPDGVLMPGPPFTRTHDGTRYTCYGMPFRRIEFPRSTETYTGDWCCDHYEDRDPAKGSHFHSTLLSHVAFLLGQGGVHQRANRRVSLIPVESIGLQRTAEIFLYALTQFYDTLPTTMEATTLIEAARLLLDAAEAVSGSKRSREYVMVRRALYAVGLYPYDSAYSRVKYGGEACMLPWTYGWRHSRPYLGFPDLRWRSPDLFVNNNGSAHEDAVVGTENRLFARVRNIGDEDLTEVRVRFFYAPLGTNLPDILVGWQPCLDVAGDECVLEIPVLPAHGMNFVDVDNPPANQAVGWYLGFDSVGPSVDAFCIRAVVECWSVNHDYEWMTGAQTSVRHVPAITGSALDMTVQIHNQAWTPLRVDMRVDSALPGQYRLRHVGAVALRRTFVARGEPRSTEWRLTVPRRRPDRLEPPFDGRIAGGATGGITGFLDAQLSESRVLHSARGFVFGAPTAELTGVMAGTIDQETEEVTVIGRFTGRVDLRTAAVTGHFRGTATCRDGRSWPGMELAIQACIEPLRAMHMSQYVGGEPIGGVTLHLKTPRLRGQCDPEDWR